MKFGTKSSDAPKFDGDYLRNFKKGETVGRFLQEPEDFIMFYEHYLGNKSFPCTEDTRRCPGCTHENADVQRRSRKYATYFYNVAQKFTAPHRLAVGLNNKMEARKDRNDGTILSRDFAVIRSGEGLNTDYDVDQEDKYEVDIKHLRSLYTGATIEEILEQSFRDLWGDPSKYEGEPEEEKPRRTRERAPEPVPEDDPPYELMNAEERAAHDAKQSEADVEISEGELKKMTRAELVTLWQKAGFEGFDEDWGKAEIVAEILKRAA